MDPALCYMLFYFGFNDLRNLLVEFGVEPNGMFKQNLHMQVMRLLDKSAHIGINIERYTKRIIEIFDKIKNCKHISAQDPRSLTTKLLVVNDGTSFNQVLRVCINHTNNTNLKIPYRYIQRIMDPTVLIGDSAGKKTLAQRIATFYFCLSPDQLADIKRNSRNIVNDRLYQLHIRICLLEPSTEEEIDYLPPGISIKLNSRDRSILPFETISNIEHGSSVIKKHSIDLTDSIKPGSNVNSITLTWIPDYKTYGVAVYFIQIPVINSTIVDDFQNKIKDISKKTIKEMIEKIEINSDLPGVKYCISLNCPVTKMRITLPVTSVNCNHLQCFDARTYILLNESNPKWKCPVCQKPCKLDDLQIQNYLWEILKSPDLPDDANNIEILHDGTWSVLYETMNRNKVISYVDLDDDSMDLEVNKTITVNDLISAGGENNKQNNVQMVDATQTISVVNLQSPTSGQSLQVINLSNIAREMITIDLTSDVEEND